MGSDVYMGTRGAEQWLRAPAPRTAFQPVGWSAVTTGRNGRAHGARSRVTHMEYDLSWPTVPTATANKISEMYHGLHGDGLIYWLDPMIQNVLPVHWSMPGLGCTDGPPIYGHVRPTAVNTASNSKGLPAVAARYTLQSNVTAKACYIPVPPGHTAHIGVHVAGSATGNSIVTARRFNGATATGSLIALPRIAASSPTRFNTTVNHTGSMTGIEIRIAPGQTIGSNTLPSSDDLAGIMVEVLPNGTSPTGNGFILGGGNSGCRIFEPPTMNPISAYRGRTSVAARLVEVGP